MNQDLDDLLCKEYPKIFRDRYADMRYTAMCWGFGCGEGWYNIIDTLCKSIQNHIDETRKHRVYALRYNRALKQAKAGNLHGLIRYYTFGNDDGSLDRAKTRAQHDLDSNAEFREVNAACRQVVATQVKEKFGTLRFYYNGGDAVVDGMVRMAESLSARVCEVCGAPGKTTGGHWLQTVCKEHDTHEIS